MAKNLMLQGTGSSVGKSLLTAGICRALVNRGYRVAPFKSQNMALNSYITKDGKEMGRAQVVQAEAAKIPPDAKMNPILLKPTSHVGSQVILEGKVLGNMDAKTYHKKKPELKERVAGIYEKLAVEYDGIIIEGAGSPAEINLREHDLVNMGLAEMVDAPVILIGDIDRGGVFASIYGTVMLLSPEERKRIKGFIINKFRGDADILMPGIRMIEEKIGIPCFGVMPYESFGIEDEDSVTRRFRERGREFIDRRRLNVGVIKLPYISNFSDFTPLEVEPKVAMKYIHEPHEVIDLDLLILPGSKNTLEDRRYLVEAGFDEYIYRAVKEGTIVMGICGGYQILGDTIRDDHGVESSFKEINGLGLLPMETTMEKEKTTRQVQGSVPEFSIFKKGRPFEENDQTARINVSGYEIHMGKTERKQGCLPWIPLEDGTLDGSYHENRKIFGTYLHGIFENDEFRRSILSHVEKERRGETVESEPWSFHEYKENEYDRLAELMENHLEMERLIEIIFKS